MDTALQTYTDLQTRTEPKTKPYIVRPCNEVRKMTLKPFPWIAKNIIPEKAITIIAGKTGCGKSLIAFYFADRISKGRNILNNEELSTQQANVLYVEMEMTEDDNIDRTQKICRSDNNVFLIYEQGFKIDDEKNVQNILDICRQHEIKVIVFDTLSKIHFKNENDNSDMTQIMEKLLIFCREYGITVICVHHYNKSVEMTGYDKSRGASSIVDNCSSFLEVESKPEVNEFGLNVLSMGIKQHKSRRSLSITEFGVEVINYENGQLAFEFRDKLSRANDIIQKYMSLVKGYVENHPGLPKTHVIQNLKESYKNDKAMTASILNDCINSLLFKKEIVISSETRGGKSGGRVKRLFSCGDKKQIEIDKINFS